MLLGGKVSSKLAEAALIVKQSLPIIRYPAAATERRAWDLRDNFTPYDASYVALAEYLDRPLVTTDAEMERQARNIEVCLY